MRSRKTGRRLTTILVLVLVVASFVGASAVFARGPKTVSTVPTQTITITTVSVTGRLVEGSRVGLFNDGYKFSKQTTGADGTVTFENVPYGTYYVDFSHNLFCSAYYKLTVDGTMPQYRIIVHPKSLWEGIGY
jgi:hypothetical protein